MMEMGCMARDSEPRTGKPRHMEYRNLNIPGHHATRDAKMDDVTERKRRRRLMGSQISSRYLGDEPIDSLGKGLTR